MGAGIVIGRHTFLGPGSDNNIIVNNTVFSNNYGVSLSGSINNTFANNSIVNNFRGMRSRDAGGNWIYHNNIIDNTEQASDDGVFNGPNQDIPGSDQIGDTPYFLDLVSQDRYPLMGPSGTYPPSAPLNLSAMAGDQQITLTWNPPSFDGGLPITNYRIYRGTTSGGEIFYAQIGSTLTFPDMGLTNGQMYCYRVSAVNGIGEGPLSNEACATPTTIPGAPVILQADLSGSGLENVTIKWNLSSDDGAGQNSVVGYSIYRGTTFDINATGYQPVANVPKGTNLYVDNFTGEGDPNNYFYQICSIDLNNLTNCSKNQAGKFTRHLLSGPNLVSIPLIQSNENIETVLQTMKWDKAWTYDSSAQKWKSHMTFKPYKGELNKVNTSMSIWINVLEQSNLTVAGIVPSSTSIYLYAGWNLVGFPSFNVTYSVSDLKATVGVESIEGFDALTPPFFLREQADGRYSIHRREKSSSSLLRMQARLSKHPSTTRPFSFFFIWTANLFSGP
jgi:parallel beta-helix repeat protein